jgi:hypothetical protein
LRLFVITLLAGALASGIAAAATTSLLPAVGASQTFSVTTHTDAPQHPAGQGQGHYEGRPPGGAAPSGAPGAQHGGFQQFFRDESGTLTFKRATDASLVVTTTGDVDAIDAPLTVTSQGTVDPGTTPNRFIVAFDNANAVATAVAGAAAGSATLSLLMPNGSVATVPIAVKVLSTTGDVTKVEGTGSGTVTMSTPHGDRPIDINATADVELSAGRLSTYTQTLEQTIKTSFRTMNITTTTTLSAQ